MEFIFSVISTFLISTFSSFSPKNISPIPLPTISILFAGDVMLGRTVNIKTLEKNDFTWAFQEVSNITRAADLFVINLETPIIPDCKPTNQGMVFCADTRHIEGLSYAGVDLASLANNHAENYGKEGLEQTSTLLSDNNISPFGLGKPVYADVKGIKISFIGFNALYSLSDEYLINQIDEARKHSDLVFAIFHWGNEYVASPSAKQVHLAHLSIDSGASAVIGHHPHWIQTSEIYQTKPIYYSLGNFVFDQMWSEETRKGLLLNLTYQNNQLISTKEIPITIHDYGQPNPD